MAISTENKDKLKKELERNDEIQITVVGRKSGRAITHTVWFVLEGGTLYLLPVKGSDTEWLKNLREQRSLKIRARDAEGQFSGNPIADRNEVSSVVKKFQQKYGVADVKKYYSKLDAAVIVNLD